MLFLIIFQELVVAFMFAWTAGSHHITFIFTCLSLSFLFVIAKDGCVNRGCYFKQFESDILHQNKSWCIINLERGLFKPWTSQWCHWVSFWRETVVIGEKLTPDNLHQGHNKSVSIPSPFKCVLTACSLIYQLTLVVRSVRHSAGPSGCLGCQIEESQCF